MPRRGHESLGEWSVSQSLSKIREVKSGRTGRINGEMPELPKTLPLPFTSSTGIEITTRRLGGAAAMPKLTRKQTGTKNKKSFTGRLAKKYKRTLNPWGGPNIPMRFRRNSKPSGSSTREPRPDPALAPQTRGYPVNQPSQWPVEPDHANYTVPPPLSGYTSDVADAHNAAVEHAYERAGYND